MSSTAKLSELSHAYLIEGERDIALREARRLARGILMPQDEATPLEALRDFREVPDEKVPIAIVRELTAGMYQRPLESAYRVLLLNYADLLREEAQNALLKSLEEPPSYIVWILVAENYHKLLPTIRSRCRLIHLSRARQDKTSLSPEEEEALFQLLRKSFAGEGAVVFDRRETLSPWVDKKTETLSAITEILQNMLQYKSIQSFVSADPRRRAHCKALCQEVSFSQICLAIEQTEQLRGLLDVNINMPMAWEHFFLHLGSNSVNS